MKYKFLVIVIAALLLINVQCDDGDPDMNVNLSVPYHQMAFTNACGLACIQMWADYDGITVSQYDIATMLGVQPGQTVAPDVLEWGVGFYTWSEGCLATKLMSVPGAKGDLIAATIYGVDDRNPSIMPFWEDHAVIIKGYQWYWDEGYKPVATNVRYHDPNGEANQYETANILDAYFMPSPYAYWVIVAHPEYVGMGLEGHNAFIVAGGTYYGGPSYYNPKGLTLDPSLN
jgi:hypothetical protein